MRVLKGSDVTVTSPTFVAADGETPTDCDTTPTVTVTRDDGTVLDVPTVDAADTGDGEYNALLLASKHTTRVDLLTLTWTGEVGSKTQVYGQEVEVVGAHIVTLNELRSLPGLESSAKVSSDLLRELRDEFTDRAEDYCGTSFVPRYRRDVIKGSGSVNLLLSRTFPTTILSASSTDTSGTVTAFTVTNWDPQDSGLLVTDGDAFTSTTYGERNLSVAYEYGLTSCPPAIKRACKDYVRAKALEQGSRVGRDLIRETSPDGFSQQWSTPDPAAGRPTGLLDVDAALNSFGRAAPSVA